MVFELFVLLVELSHLVLVLVYDVTIFVQLNVGNLLSKTFPGLHLLRLHTAVLSEVLTTAKVEPTLVLLGSKVILFSVISDDVSCLLVDILLFQEHLEHLPESYHDAQETSYSTEV